MYQQHDLVLTLRRSTMQKLGITITVDVPTDCLMPGETGTEPDVQLLPTPSNAELNEKFEAGLNDLGRMRPGPTSAIASVAAKPNIWSLSGYSYLFDLAASRRIYACC